MPSPNGQSKDINIQGVLNKLAQQVANLSVENAMLRTAIEQLEEETQDGGLDVQEEEVITQE